MISSPQDWLGLQGEYCQAVATEVLSRCAAGRTTGEEAECAAFRAAAALGKCRLFGVALGEWDGTLPVPVALAAAQRLAHHLRVLQEEARQLGEAWDAADDEVEARELSLQLLEARTEVWAAFVALGESYQDGLENALAGHAALGQALDGLFEALPSVDEELRRQEDLLSLAASTNLLDNWRRLLAEPYGLPLPWWLDGSLEETANRVWQDCLRLQPRGRSIVSRLRPVFRDIFDAPTTSLGMAAGMGTRPSLLAARAALAAAVLRVERVPALRVSFDLAIGSRGQWEWRVFVSPANAAQTFKSLAFIPEGGSWPLRGGVAVVPLGAAGGDAVASLPKGIACLVKLDGDVCPVLEEITP